MNDLTEAIIIFIVGMAAGVLTLGTIMNYFEPPTREVEINRTFEHNNTITELVFVNVTHEKEVYMYICNNTNTDDLNKKSSYTIHGGWKPSLNNSFWNK